MTSPHAPEGADDDAPSSLAPRVHVGCAGLPVPRADYGRTLGVVELRNTFVQPPKPRTSAEWRAELGSGCAVSFCAWQLVCGEPAGGTWRGLSRPIPPAAAARYGAFRDTEEVAEAWRATRASAEALGARVMLFSCPPSFTPTGPHKEALRRFFERTERGGLLFALELGGVWEAEEQLAVAAECGVVLTTDPLHEESPVTEGPVAYYRLRGPATGRYRYDEYDLQALAERCAAHEESFVIFHGVEMWQDARRFAGLVGAE